MRKTVMALIVLLLVFFLIFIYAMSMARRGQGIFDMFPPLFEDGLIMVLSLLAIVKVVYEIIVQR